jgi:hypothetical protein
MGKKIDKWLDDEGQRVQKARELRDELRRRHQEEYGKILDAASSLQGKEAAAVGKLFAYGVPQFPQLALGNFQVIFRQPSGSLVVEAVLKQKRQIKRQINFSPSLSDNDGDREYLWSTDGVVVDMDADEVVIYLAEQLIELELNSLETHTTIPEDISFGHPGAVSFDDPD